MRVNRLCFLLALPACILMYPAAAAVSVSFVKPDSYTDAGQSARDTETAMQAIEVHLKHLGERYLPPNQILKIEVLDIALAGRRPVSIRLNPEARILRGRADWPSIKLHYVLESGSHIIDDRQENIANMNYLQHPKGRYSAQSFPYEKQMLEEWFRRRFATDSATRN
jgi:Protein of unknown function (DUF3016)